MFDSPQYPKHSQLCLTQSPKYYHQNQNQIFIGSYDYEPFNFQGDGHGHVDHGNQVFNLNLNLNWSAYSQRTPKTDRISQPSNIQISYYDSTFTDRSMDQGNISIISEKRRRAKNKNQDFSEFISTNQNTLNLNPNNIFKEVSIAKVKQQLKNLTKNMLKLKQDDKVRQPLQQHNNDNNINSKKQKRGTQQQQQPPKFRHINRKNMPTRKNVPKFKKNQTTKENTNTFTSIYQTQKKQQIQTNLQLTNVQLNNIQKIDQKLHDTYLQIYRFNKRKEEELIKKQLQKQQALNKYKQLQQKKARLKQNLAKKKQILIEKQQKIHEDSDLFIQKLRKQKKGQFTNDWNQYFMT